MDFADFLHGVESPTVAAPGRPRALSDDLNTPSAFSIIHGSREDRRRRSNAKMRHELKATLQFVGLYGNETAAEFRGRRAVLAIDEAKIER